MRIQSSSDKKANSIGSRRFGQKKLFAVLGLLLFLSPLVVSLFTNNTLGGSVLFPLFYFSLFAFIVAIAALTYLLSIRKNSEPPRYTLIYLFFVVSIIANCLITDSFGYVHLYYLASGAFLFSTSLVLNQKGKFIFYIHIAITILSIFESGVVILQVAGVLNSNENFLCTGTWANPNVTAIFLASSLFSVFSVINRLKRQWLKGSLFMFVIISILLLNCRTANIIAIFSIFYQFGSLIWHKIKSNLRLTISSVALIFLSFIITLLFLSPFLSKQESMRARLFIWENSVKTGIKQPIYGHGFGRFEREYNLFISENENPNNHHVNTAYNDFLELFVEGGIIALLLWVLFLVSVVIYCYRHKTSYLPLISVCIVQLTNFGILAIPFYALFIIYCAIGYSSGARTDENDRGMDSVIKNRKLFFLLKIVIVVISVVAFLKTSETIRYYYQHNKLAKEKLTPATLIQFEELKSKVDFSNGYHENYGNALMKVRLYRAAVYQYRTALKSCSRPDVFAKCGYCYQRLGMFDSSKYFYEKVQAIEPMRLIPKMALLKLYEEVNDTLQVQLIAKKIVSNPGRVQSRRAKEIKNYALLLIKRIDSINALKDANRTIKN